MEVEKFIKNFDFENPDWINLPEGFPICDTSSLNKEEAGLYSGIVTAWIIDTSAEINEYLFQKMFIQKTIINGLYRTGKILIFLLFLILITGNLINYILIEVYHSIL